MMTRKECTDSYSVDDAIRRVRKGDTAAFEVIVRQLERSLRAWLAVQAPPGVDVDEVAQRSFVAAFTRLSEYESGTNFAAWLFTIARFHLKTEVSRLRRVADYHVRYAPRSAAARIGTPEFRATGAPGDPSGAFADVPRTA